ncbi:MAG: hypothetical protein V4696_04235 [Pseudomonadota bacterium]
MLALLMAAALGASAPEPAPAPDPAATAFTQLKSLVGTWRNAANPASPLRINFYLTANGTVLVEEWRRGTDPHSLTLYHRDGAALVATHYCPQGNQPRLALSSTGKTLRFDFRDATDLDPRTESHQHDLAFDLADPARPVRSETYRSAAGAEDSSLTLVRAPD